MKPALLSTLDDIQAHVPVAMTSEFNTVSPYLRQAEQSHVVKLIGKVQFNALKDAFEAGTDDENLQLAINLCQKIVANIGYYLALPVLSVSVSSAGVQIFSSESTKNAFQWQVEDLKDSLQEIGFAGIEELLELLDSEPITFSEYHTSEEYNYLHSFLLTSAADFNKQYDISNSRYLFHALQAIMKRVEDQVMIRTFGADFYDGLKSTGQAGKKQILIDKYLKPGLALLTIAKALVERVVTLDGGKVVFNFRGNYNNIKESMPVDREQLSEMAKQLTDDGNDYISAGMLYINENPSDFEGFVQPQLKRRFKFNNVPEKGVFGL